MDWWQILYAFIGSFLGFGFALIAEAIVNYIKEKKERRMRRVSLVDELSNIAKLFKGNEDKRAPIYIEVPVWQAICATGTLFSFLKEDAELYNAVMQIYNNIFALRALEKDIDENAEEISDLRRIVISQIDKFTGSCTEDKGGKQ